MPEMLTVKQTAQKLKKLHPDTPISEHAIRAWQKEKRFHSVTAGRVILISWDSFVSFLSGKGA